MEVKPTEAADTGAKSRPNGQLNIQMTRPAVSGHTPTIKDVARAAGVSVSTVSHVFNKTRPVSEKTARRVRSAIDSLGYRPSRLAQALKGERTMSVGLLIDKIDAFTAELVSGAEERCFERGYSLALCSGGSNVEQWIGRINALAERRVDGVLLAAAPSGQQAADALAAARFQAAVVVGGQEVPKGAQELREDAALGGALAAEHLLARGLRKVGVLTGPAHDKAAAQRVAGFEAGVNAAGLTIARTHRVSTPLSVEGGRAGAAKILARATKPEALYCASDVQAVGALRAIEQAGLRPCEDVSVIGYGDSDLAATASPALTMLRRPARKMGQAAADALINAIEGGAGAEAPAALAPELISRESVKS